MKLAFALFKYFPYGGLQRDCLKIAEECVRRGHSVDIFTLQAEGEIPAEMNLLLLPQRAFQNYRRYELFADEVVQQVHNGGYSALIGFNKMPCLDLYYAADPCFAAKVRTRSFFYRWSRRTRSFLKSEAAVFGADSRTHSLLISPAERTVFSEIYRTDPGRIHLLPPGIQRDRLAGNDYNQVREEKRRELGLAATDHMLLMVGSGFKTKGLDRSLRAVAALPEALKQQVKLYVVGQDNSGPFLRLARTLGLERQCFFLGGRDDVAELLFSADLLLHPAYRENTGTVILEAMAATLPLLVSKTCGYSFYVDQAHCGRVLSEPFSQHEMNTALAEMLVSPQHSVWRENAEKYIRENDVFSMPQRAVDIIEQVAS
jgi:UDP-glucose:(heptosyl)LPS alpha-1,3-glucosyltransferase